MRGHCQKAAPKGPRPVKKTGTSWTSKKSTSFWTFYALHNPSVFDHQISRIPIVMNRPQTINRTTRGLPIFHYGKPSAFDYLRWIWMCPRLFFPDWKWQNIAFFIPKGQSLMLSLEELTSVYQTIGNEWAQPINQRKVGLMGRDELGTADLLLRP